MYKQPYQKELYSIIKNVMDGNKLQKVSLEELSQTYCKLNNMLDVANSTERNIIIAFLKRCQKEFGHRSLEIPFQISILDTDGTFLLGKEDLIERWQHTPFDAMVNELDCMLDEDGISEAQRRALIDIATNKVFNE